MLRHFYILLIVTCITACSHGDGDKEQRESGGVNLFLGKLQIPLFDSISIHVFGENMESIHASANSIKDNIKIDGIPFGENRKFEVKIYADYGKPVQEGEATADLNSNQTVTIPISLKALAGFLRLEIPLGLLNNTDVHSGTLFLDSLEFQMQIENGKGIFNTGALPLNQIFALSLELKNSKEEIIFIGQKPISLSSILQTETMQLQSTRGSVILELETSYNGPAQILAMLPISVSRQPENYGDLFFTEIFADPKSTGGEYFQYMEIYNATLDTLEISHCRIAVSINTTTVGQNRMNFPEDLILPPMEYIFLGRDSVMNADFNYEKFRLTKTGMSFGFFCGNLAIDTLTFSAIGDNPFPLALGKAMQLPLSNFANRAIGTSWCFGSSPRQDALCQ
jgi:hypothetical protein